MKTVMILAAFLIIMICAGCGHEFARAEGKVVLTNLTMFLSQTNTWQTIGGTAEFAKAGILIRMADGTEVDVFVKNGAAEWKPHLIGKYVECFGYSAAEYHSGSKIPAVIPQLRPGWNCSLEVRPSTQRHIFN
jgi:hypothetical protein